MSRLSILSASVAVLLATGGCNLDVQNPNSPDKNRAFTDPAGLTQLMGGAFRTWVEARSGYFVMPLTAQADNYTASWNNAAIRFYTSVNSDCPSRCGWTNSAIAPEAAGGPTVEAQWYGYYSVLSSANDVLAAIKSGLCFDDDCTADSTITTRNKAIATMLQGMSLAGIALMYDQGFIVDENTALPDDPAAYPPFSPRAQVRDAALQKFEAAYTLAGLAGGPGVDDWETEAEWMGVGAGTPYTSVQIQQVIRTMQAELVAMFPRDGAEATAADWTAVANYASQGVSSGTPFDWEYFIDVTGRECGNLDCVKSWGNSILTMRVDTRVAKLVTTNHQDPWPGGSGNPCPTISPDKRVGDGTYGPTNSTTYGTKAATVNAGTDFACSAIAIFPAARGQYHQSNLQHIRYQRLAARGENLPGFDGTGQDPFYTRQMNNLLWAEGLVRSNTNLALAAQLIDSSHVGRGGLPTVAGGSQAQLLTALQYEQEIEFMGQGATPLFNRRRINGLIAGTPRHMPVPAKELDVLHRSLYTFGGPTLPDKSAAVDGIGVRRQTVRERWAEIQAMRPKSVGARF